MSDPKPEIWLGDDGIMRVQYPPNCHLTMDVMGRIHRKHLGISRVPCPILVHAESVASAEYEAQRFASRDDVAALVTGMAIIVKSAFTRAMADLFMRFHKPPYPTRVFADEQSATAWLTQFLPADSVSSEAGDNTA